MPPDDGYEIGYHNGHDDYGRGSPKIADPELLLVMAITSRYWAGYKAGLEAARALN